MASSAANRTLLVRVVLVALSVLACAWFVLGAVQVHAEGQASKLLSVRGGFTPAQAAHVRHLLSRAGALNPDQTIAIMRAEVDLKVDHRPAAESLMQRVVGDEPQNIAAWLVLDIAAYGRDGPVARLAAAKRQELAPPVPAAP